MKITKRFVEQVEIPSQRHGKPTQTFYRDDELRGFALRVTSGGAKSFVFERRIKGPVRRITLGRFEDLTIARARRKAERMAGEIADDQDPIANRKRTKLERITLGRVLDDYLAARKDLKPRTVEDYRMVTRWGFSDWLARPLTIITKEQVATRHTVLGKRSPARANNAFRVLRALFNYAIALYEDQDGDSILASNPVSVLGQTRAWYRIERRNRYLKDHELAPWYEATLTIDNETTRDYLHFLLFTGLRKSEGLRLRWGDVDLEDRTLKIDDTKNRVPHILPLSDFLEAMLRRRSADQCGPYVFPGNEPGKHLVEPRRGIERVVRLSGVAFGCHDLRRTFATIAERLDLSAFTLMRLINHKRFMSDVTAGYIGGDIERLREPMQRIASYMNLHMHSADGRVVSLQARK